MKHIAINGFGRIGRAAFKIALEHQDKLKVVAINDLFDTKTLAHLLQYDSVYGKYEKTVKHDANSIIVDGIPYPVYAEKEPQKLPWGTLGVDTVIESTGIFTSEEKMKLHIEAGAKKVMLSAPPKGGGVATHIMGVSDIARETNPLKSIASCTTNSITAPIRILHDSFGVLKALLTTIHGYTADQNLVDGPHRDLRRARAAALNIIPTTTGAAISTTEVIKELKGKFDGVALRVPVSAGSISDITALLSKTVTVEEVNNAFKEAADSAQYKGIIGVSEDPIVSSDILKTSFSGIIDLPLTKVVDGDLVKIFSWYDNEWGYTCRLIEAVIQS